MNLIKRKRQILAGFDLFLPKSLLIMKCFVLILFIGTLQSFVTVNYAQTVRISLDMKNTPVKEILSAIEEKSEFYFTYNLNQVNVNRTASVSVKDKDVTEILSALFAKENINYKINDRHIVLYKLDKKNGHGVPGLPQTTKKVSGVVMDESGVPVIGASVVIKGTSKGTVSDMNGKFEVEVAEGSVIRVSFIGYNVEEMKVDNVSLLIVTLKEDSKLIDEVVVVGYGTQKKGNLTGSISTIKANEIGTTTSASLAQSIQGKIPGLQIRQQTGEPGEFSSSINIRGFGEPLYVIDGIVRDGGNEFQQLNPNDIENISILKDASAAIYGLNASNGVIMVTTKKGKSGKPRFSYGGVVGMQRPTNVPKMASASQYMEMYNDAIMLRDGTPAFSNEELAKWSAGGPGYESTNWYDETMKKSAMQTQHDFSVSGGNDVVNYFVSFGYYNEEGLLKSNDMNYDRYNLRSNITAKLTKNLTADVMLAGRYSLREYPGGDGFIWMYKGTIISLPNEKPYINGDLNYPANIYNQQNAVMMSQRDYAGYTENNNKSFQSSATLTYDVPFVSGLQAKGTIAYDSNNMFNKNVWKNYKVYSPDLTTQVVNPPRIANAVDDGNRVVMQMQLAYNRTFAYVHTVGATMVYEQKKYSKKYAYLKREYEFFTNDIVDQASGLQTNRGNEEEFSNMSYLGRFNYNFKGKYMLEYLFRYDGSSRYAPENRWAFFPAVSVGWRISEEGFIKDNLKFVDNLKLRGSLGSIGENVGDPYQHVLGYSSRSNDGYEFLNGDYTGGLAAPGVVNRNFSWVKSKITDIGIEASVLNNMLSLEFDYYQRDKTGKLKIREGGLPNTFGGDMPIENLESERTRGFDFMVSHQNKIDKFKYGVSFNMNLARSMHRIVDKPEARSSYDKWRYGLGNRWYDMEWGWNNIGQFQNKEDILQGTIHGDNLGNTKILPGDYIYEDTNGDGVINVNDMQPLFRNRLPKLFYGFTLNGGWNNFDFNLVFQGASLYTIRFNEVFSQMFFNNGNLPAYFYDRWHLSDPENSNSEWVSGKWPANRFVEYMHSSYKESSAWRMNATYLRLKSLEVGYTIPSNITKKYFLDNVRIYANAHNLLTFADAFLKQFDPEKYEGDYQAGYNYPLTKSFNIGLDISF